MKRPPVGAYDPYITIASPGGKPVTKPRFRVLMSKSMWKQWENAVAQAGDYLPRMPRGSDGPGHPPAGGAVYHTFFHQRDLTATITAFGVTWQT